MEVEFDEGEAKPKSYTSRLTMADGAPATKEGLPFRSPHFKLCTWRGFVGLDTKPAAVDVSDIRRE